MSTLFKDSIVYAEYGETIAVGDMLYMSQGTGADSARTAGQLYKLEIANPDRNVFYGIAKEAGIADDTNKKVVTGGKFDGLAGLTPGLPIYADPTVAGGVTQVRPASNVQVIGVAIDADSFSVNGALAGSFGAGEGSGGVGGVDILFVQDFETAALGDFTQTGLVLSGTNPLKGAISANLVHDDTINQSFKETRPVDEKFRNRNITLKLNIKSAASAGNVTLTVVDETNAVTLVSSEQLPVSNDVGGAIGQVSFDMPDDCLSFSYEVVALPEAGSPVTIVDDIIAEITSLIDEQSVLVQEADSYLIASGNSGGSATANVTDIPFNNVIRNVGSDIQFNTTSVTILTDGVYDFSVLVNITATTAVMGIYKNGTILAGMSPSANSNTKAGSYSGYFEAGDVVSFRLSTTSTLQNSSTDHVLSVTKQGSLKQVNPNPNSKITIPTSELRMEGASTRGSTATAIVRFDNIAKIRGDAFEVLSDAALGTRIVMKKKGKLDFHVHFNRGLTATDANLTINQQTLTGVGTAEEILAGSRGSTGAGVNVSLSWSGDVNVGDILRVASGINPTDSGGNNRLALFFQEQDISVSVTNTLPQFSESDSSVRVDTANGYGSTGTTVRRFSNVRDNIGNDIEYVPSAVNGDSFVVKSAGIYHISYTEGIDNYRSGITLNATGAQLSTSTLTLSDQTNNPLLTSIAVGSNGIFNSAWSGHLQVGDIIRAQTDGTASNGNNRTKFTISKVGKPNVTGVDVTPFVNIPQKDVDSAFVSGATDRGSTATAVLFFPNLLKSPSKGLFRVDSDSVLGTRVTVLKAGTIHLHASVAGSSNAPFRQITRNQQTLTAISTSNLEILSSANASGSAATPGNLSVSLEAQVGDVFRVVSSQNPSVDTRFPCVLSVYMEAASDNLLSPTESFSTDIASLTYAPSSLYTLANLDTAPVGTFITFTYAAGGNVRTQTTTAPTQSTSDMNVNGIRLFARDHALASTADEPSAIAIQIGKGKKGRSLDLYKNVAKAIGGELESLTDGALVTYSEVSGVLLVDVGYRGDTSSTPAFVFEDVSTQANGYLVINASKSPSLTGVPLVQPRIATIKDVKASGTEGGTFTSGVYQTRVLNTLQDPTGIVTSLASNQFTLPAGRYYIEAVAPASSLTATAPSNHKAKLRNITDSSDVIIGSSMRLSLNNAGTAGTNASVIHGVVDISSPKVFELQHRCAVTTGTSGFGIAAGFGDDEVYSTVKITKIK
jgi:hypothetical protein